MIAKSTQTSRSNVSRKHTERKVTYTPPNDLDAPKPNSDDMKFLGENLFGIWYAIYTPEAQEAIRKNEEEVAKLNQQAQS